MDIVVAHICSGLAKFLFPFTLPPSSCSVYQSAARGWCFVVLLLWSSLLLHLAGGFMGASNDCVVSHLFPPWIKEAVSSALDFPLLAPVPLFALPCLSLACRHLSTVLREAVLWPCSSVSPHYPKILDLASHTHSLLSAILLYGLPLHRVRRRWGAIQEGLKMTDRDPSSNLFWKVSCAKDPHPH